jgi:hypothetical protein
MSASSQIRLSGLSVLLATSGETLNSGATAVTALVNRQPKKVKDMVKDGAMDFGIAGLTEVEFAMDGTFAPSVGNAFNDALGFRHRIVFVTNTDISWVCYCTQSKV